MLRNRRLSLIIALCAVVIGYGVWGFGQSKYGASRISGGGGSPIAPGFWQFVNNALSPVNNVDVSLTNLSVAGTCTGCGGGATPNLNTVTAQGATSTASVLLYGGVTSSAMTATSTLTFQTSLIGHRVATTGNYTVLGTDYFVSVSTTGSFAPTITLPSNTSSAAGRILIIKDKDGNATSSPITLQAAGLTTIDATSTWQINSAWGSMRLISDGVSNWEAF